MTLRVLQWGCGRWGVNVLRDLVALGADVTVVALDEQTAERAFERGATSCIGVDDVAVLDRPDGVVVVTPASHHADAIRASAGFGVPIFTEKPLTHDVSEAERLVAELGDRLFVMHKWRWHPGIEAISALVTAGTIGRPVLLTCTRLGLDMHQDDVDAIDTLVPHDLSIAFGVLGRLPTRARGAVGEPWPDRPGSWLGGHVLLRDAHDDPAVALHFSGTTAARLRRVEIVGDEGTAVLTGPSATEVEVVSAGRRAAIPLDPVMPLEAELSDFLTHCAGGPPPRATAAEGLAVVQALATVRRALDDS